jgi:FtsZ-binding cell division protein ZapB
MATNHANELEELRNKCKEYQQRYLDICKDKQNLRRENDELREKLSQYEDWNRRLMEFMDMSVEDRQVYVDELKAKLHAENKLNALLVVYGKIFYGIFN